MAVEGDLTDGGFAELLVGDLVGDVGAHEHADVHLQTLPDEVRDEPQARRARVDPLREEPLHLERRPHTKHLKEEPSHLPLKRGALTLNT